MNEKKSASRLILDLMRSDTVKSLHKDDQKELRDQIISIVRVAQEQVIEDAEEAISNLRTFSILL